MNYQILADAGIPKLLFAHLLGVSHAAVSHWVVGRCAVHPLREKKVKKLLNAIELAVKSGDLPVHVSPGQDTNEARIEAIKKHLDAPKPQQ